MGLIVLLFSNNYIIGGGISLISFIGYVFVQPHQTWLAGVFLLAGMLLIIIEIFIPGFGVSGLLGACSLVAGIVLLNQNWIKALADIGVSTIVACSLMLFLLKKGFSVKIGQQLILDQQLTRNRGYSSSKTYRFLEGQVGTTTTMLRPVGKAMIGNHLYDVISDGEIILAHTSVIVTKVEGNSITVSKHIHVKEEVLQHV